MQKPDSRPIPMRVDIVAKHKHKQRPIKLEATFPRLQVHCIIINSRMHVFTFLSHRCSVLLLYTVSTYQPISIHTITINAKKSERRKTESALHSCLKCLRTINLLCWSNKRRFASLFDCSSTGVACVARTVE